MRMDCLSAIGVGDRFIFSSYSMIRYFAFTSDLGRR